MVVGVSVVLVVHDRWKFARAREEPLDGLGRLDQGPRGGAALRDVAVPSSVLGGVRVGAERSGHVGGAVRLGGVAVGRCATDGERERDLSEVGAGELGEFLD